MNPREIQDSIDEYEEYLARKSKVRMRDWIKEDEEDVLINSICSVEDYCKIAAERQHKCCGSFSPEDSYFMGRSLATLVLSRLQKNNL